MSSKSSLDLDLLRTLVAIADEGSFTRAAARIGRTQSAVSLQMQRLEAVVGRELVRRRKGSAVELSEAGRMLLEQSRELLDLSDRALQNIQQPEIQGEVRLGAWEGYAKLFLAPVLTQFTERYPRVSVEIFSGLSCQLLPLMLDNRLDAMVCDNGMEPHGWPTTALWRTKLRWITSDECKPHIQDPLCVSLGPPDCPWRPVWLAECLWRVQALRALDATGRRYRIMPTLTTVAGWDSSVLSGLAVTVSTLPVLPAGLRAVRRDEALPELPEGSILVMKATRARQPVSDCLVDFLAKSSSVKNELTSAE
jgi:DNA-binding transcriptional LysR family regulator